MRFLIVIFVSVNLFAADIAPFVPRPTWGIDETLPTRPSDWSSEVAGYYYIKDSDAGATDTGRTYGTPTAPRNSVPNPLPAGSYVEVAGTYAVGATATFQGRGNSSTWAANSAGPVWITSDPNDRAIFLEGMSIVNSTNLYFDGIISSNTLTSGNAFEVGETTVCKYIMLRNSSINGDGVSDTSGVTIRGSISVMHENYIINSNIVWRCGDVTTVEDQDCIGISASRFTSYGLVSSNIVYLTSGPGIRLGSSTVADSAATASDPNNAAYYSHHLYAHANHSWSNLQCNYWIKFGSNIVFSQNIAHHALPHPVGGNPGMGFGGQYSPYNTIWINNYSYSNSYGFRFESFGYYPQDYTNYIIGNVFYKSGLAHDSTWNTADDGEPAGMSMNNSGGSKTFVANNTIWDSISGIHQSSSGGTFNYVNNIVGELSRTDSWHLQHRDSGAVAVTATTNVFYDSVTAPRIRWDANTYTVAQWISNTSTGDGTITDDPLLDDPTANDFGLNTSSPAKDTGHDLTLLFGHDWVARLNTIHGTSTTLQDLNGVSRPQNSLWDIGATEFSIQAPATYSTKISGNVIFRGNVKIK